MSVLPCILPDTIVPAGGTNRRSAPLFAAALVLLLAGAAPAGPDPTVYLRAQTIYFDQNSGLSTYQGKVDITRGDLRIRADKAVVKQKGNQVDDIVAFGNPIVLTRSAGDSTPATEIRGQRLHYKESDGVVTITGNVVTTRGYDIMHSDRLVYRIESNHTSAERTPGSSPVRANIWPRPAGTPERQKNMQTQP